MSVELVDLQYPSAVDPLCIAVMFSTSCMNELRLCVSVSFDLNGPNSTEYPKLFSSTQPMESARLIGVAPAHFNRASPFLYLRVHLLMSRLNNIRLLSSCLSHLM
jgi:hypothetical protein